MTQCSPAEEQWRLRSFICENLKFFKLLSIINYNGERNEWNITKNDDTYTEFAQLNINMYTSCHLADYQERSDILTRTKQLQSWGFNSCRKLVFQSFNSVTKLGATPSSRKSHSFPFFLCSKNKFFKHMTTNGRDFVTLTYHKGNFITLPAALQDTSLWNFIKGKSK
jgi:hypothetical protein